MNERYGVIVDITESLKQMSTLRLIDVVKLLPESNPRLLCEEVTQALVRVTAAQGVLEGTQQALADGHNRLIEDIWHDWSKEEIEEAIHLANKRGDASGTSCQATGDIVSRDIDLGDALSAIFGPPVASGNGVTMYCPPRREPAPLLHHGECSTPSDTYKWFLAAKDNVAHRTHKGALPYPLSFTEAVQADAELNQLLRKSHPSYVRYHGFHFSN